MAELTAASPALPEGVAWKKWKPFKGSVLAALNTGVPFQVNTENGTETVHPGMYAVQVGTIEHAELIPPRDGVPGRTVVHKVPKVEVMLAEDFEALYEPA